MTRNNLELDASKKKMENAQSVGGFFLILNIFKLSFRFEKKKHLFNRLFLFMGVLRQYRLEL